MTFSSLFDTTANVSRITSARPDLASAGIDTATEILDWYTAFGSSETEAQGAIDLVTGLDESYLLTLRPDVAAAVTAGGFISATHWYLENTAGDGLFAGVAPSASFDATAYLAANTDLGAAGLTTAAEAINHYVRFGAAEGRSADGSATTTTTTFDGTSFTLTTGLDTVTGTSDNNQITGLQDNSNDTYTTGDTIDGGAGTDRLSLTISDATPNPVVDLTNVEQVYIRTTATETVEADFWTGVTEIWNDRSSGVLTVDNITAIAAVGLNNTDAQTIIQFQDSVVSGSSDALTITVADSGTSTADVNLDIGNQTGAANDVFETVTITSSGSDESFVNLADVTGSTTTLNVTGTVAIDLAAVDVAALSTVDASGNTGGVTLDLNGAARDLTITGSSGNDDIDLSGTYTTADSINFGDGASDILAINVAEADPTSAVSNITGLDVLAIADSANNDTVDAAQFGVNRVQFRADSTTLPVVEGITSGATLWLDTAVQNFGSTTAADINLSDAAGAGDSITIDIDNTAGAGNYDLDLTGIESVTIDASGSDQANNVDIDSAVVTSYTVNAGDGDLTLTTTTGGTALATVDASSTTGSGGLILTLDSSAVAGATVTGTANTDVITEDSSQDDAISLGAGADTVNYTNGGADTYDLGSDTDIDNFEIETVTEASQGFVVSNFSTQDILHVNAASVDTAEVQVTAARAATALDDTDTIIFEQTAGAAGSITSGGTETISDFTDTADVEAFLDEQFSVAADDEAVVILNDGTNTYIYYIHENDSGATLEADEVYLLGTINNFVVTADDLTVA